MNPTAVVVDDVQWKLFSTLWRILQAAAEASVGQDALTKCREMNERARIHSNGVDGYRMGAGWVTTMDCDLATMGEGRR